MRNLLKLTAVCVCLALAGLWARSAPTVPTAGTVIKDVICVRNPTWVTEITCPLTPPCSGSGYRCVAWWNPRGDCTFPLPGAACMETDRYTEVAARRADCVFDPVMGICVCGEFRDASGVMRTIDDCQ